MRHILGIILVIAFLGSAHAFELGNQQTNFKNNSHVGQNPCIPDGREGGENMESAFLIESIPFTDTGNTSGHVDNYDEACPYTGSTSPDLVYKYQPFQDIVLSVDLCGSSYDTKTYIYEGSGNLVYCNDDFYFDDTCGNYVSKIEEAYLSGGITYYIVIDGYGGDGGNYLLNIEAFDPPPPCIIDCQDDEGEPALVDGYMDNFNGGCNSPEFGNPFSVFFPFQNGELTFCGQGGWYITSDGGNSRDTDWYTTVVGSTGMIEWTLDAEMQTYGFLLGPNDCDTVGVVDQILVGPCDPLSMVIQGAPGDIVWLWVGASEFEAPDGFPGNEYMYINSLTGIGPDPLDTKNVTIGGIKSLYR